MFTKENEISCEHAKNSNYENVAVQKNCKE
jgi:hypothetical protein